MNSRGRSAGVKLVGQIEPALMALRLELVRRGVVVACLNILVAGGTQPAGNHDIKRSYKLGQMEGGTRHAWRVPPDFAAQRKRATKVSAS